MNKEQILRRRVNLLTGSFIVGLAVSGLTAIPLLPEVNWLATHFGASEKSSGLAEWFLRVRDALTKRKRSTRFFSMARIGSPSGISSSQLQLSAPSVIPSATAGCLILA
jgi:hypothetical protein